MGDSITTIINTAIYLAIFAGGPTLIFGLPIAVLVYLSARRRRQLNSSPGSAPAWLVAVVAFAGVGAVFFLLMAVGFTT